MSNQTSFERTADAHCIFEKCRGCGEALIFSIYRATAEAIEQAKRDHVCKPTAGSLSAAA